ncbi:tRNA (adenosine(37)-N6)-threonylcarbamoyltransferase complex dimerization subunit type 1 TsaB [Parenemella sanctibonifatiensis]|uniref:tRNA (Adenosine(37)-N6)-threonylcarbamoyltransferase complex dimerization subunit type 1 TsaB n=1 Tax=Parenemella sanctibonifatiensis TaxID=2016505 RepID=A0A255EHL2_9ACTN|nr:tRNA (adenosine(37)-N6)-threonylcarbamoyltransferase complex dimerization subunit type 1 TsaB [Parenemella sanctibonifatiensis]OYN87613.1 tRNA (adenosine(37)-N6)-threonylcarbamoyltransferase complex dimerization subunit type 1 TsaB [Parenemella sanctibonifatiensis]
MTWTLAVDTSTGVRIGLARDGVPVDRWASDDPRRQVEDLAPAIGELLQRHQLAVADLARIVVGMGPGPFTGLRVGIVTAWTLARVNGITATAVCSLDVLAAQAVAAGITDDFVVATDARRKELYWASYAAGVRQAQPQVSAASELPPLTVVGPGARLYPVPGPVSDVAPDLDAALMAATELPEVPAEPMYLRPPDAVVPTGRKSALTALRRR